MWRAVPMAERMAILYRLADLLDAHDDEASAINALDNGTPVSAMRSGAYTAAWTRYYAGWIDKLDGEVVPVAGDALDVVLPEPYGVIGAIVPWNGPMMGMGQKAVPALAAGNTVVVKPPEIAPFGALRFAELALEAGLPPGALNVVVGGAAAGDALVRHPGVDKVSFTGGCATARLVMAAAAETLTPLTFELGGKSANIVFPDADLDVATSMAAMLGAVLLSGQGCALPTRLYVHDDVYDDVVARVVAQIEAVRVGDPFDPTVLMGPVVNAAACERILGVIARAVDEGAGNAAHRRSNGSTATSPTATSSRRPSSATSTTTARWPARRSSARCCRCCASTTRTRSWPRPTTATSDCPPTCTRATASRALRVAASARGRHRHRERLPRHVAGRAVRRREAERLRSRGWARRHRGVRPPQEHRLRLALVFGAATSS